MGTPHHVKVLQNKTPQNVLLCCVRAGPREGIGPADTTGLDSSGRAQTRHG